MTTESRFNKETKADTTKNNNTVGFGLNLQLSGDEPEYVGIFINVQKDSIAETMLLNDDGSYDLEVLTALLSISGEKGRVYETGKSVKKSHNKQELLDKLFGIKEA